jgi:hypothetical protein
MTVPMWLRSAIDASKIPIAGTIKTLIEVNLPQCLESNQPLEELHGQLNRRFVAARNRKL